MVEIEIKTVPAWYQLASLQEKPLPPNLQGRRCRIETPYGVRDTFIDEIRSYEGRGVSISFTDTEIQPLSFGEDSDAQWCTSPVRHIIVVAEDLLVTIFAPPKK